MACIPSAPVMHENYEREKVFIYVNRSVSI